MALSECQNVLWYAAEQWAAIYTRHKKVNRVFFGTLNEAFKTQAGMVFRQKQGLCRFHQRKYKTSIINEI